MTSTLDYEPRFRGYLDIDVTIRKPSKTNGLNKQKSKKGKKYIEEMNSHQIVIDMEDKELNTTSKKVFYENLNDKILRY